MKSARRIGSEGSATRKAILKAAVDVLEEKGAEGLTASSIGERAGLKAHMVHYYFRSINDLIVELVRTLGDLGLRNTARAMASDEPLRALWEVEIGSKWGIAVVELAATATRRDLARSEMMRYVEQMRALQAEAIARHFELRGFESPLPPMVLVTAIIAIARQIVRERTYGVSIGHQATVAAVETFLAQLPNRSDPGKAEAPLPAEPESKADRKPRKSGKRAVS